MSKPKHGRAVHRRLHLTSPLTKGPDVRALQQAVRAALHHRKIDWLPVTDDGELGKQTLHAVAFYAWVSGLSGRERKAIKSGTVTEHVQRVLRDPRKRSRRDRIRESRRRKRLAEIRKRQGEGAKAAVAYGRECVGITESPAGSNTGPTRTLPSGRKAGISFWESYWGLGACYWCLVFACYCVRAIGGAKIPGPDQAYLCVNAAEIERQARAHENGWVAVPLGQERPGDISLWCFDGSGAPDHGELVAGKYDGASNDIGGNTSTSGSSGSQSNGGGVFFRGDRDLSQLTCIARPLYS